MNESNPVGLSPFGHDVGEAITRVKSEDGLAYFGHFGVDEGLLRASFDKALSRGGDWAELFFEHRIGHHVGLQDGAVNRAYSAISLGVGIRVIRGDQTGYAYRGFIAKLRLKRREHGRSCRRRQRQAWASILRCDADA